MWLVCKTRAKILLSDPETSLPQSSGSSRNILKRLGRSGRSGRSYGNQALKDCNSGKENYSRTQSPSLLGMIMHGFERVSSGVENEHRGLSSCL